MDTKNLISRVPGDSGIEEKKEGKLLQRIEMFLDIGFPPDKMPKVLNALIIKQSCPTGVGYTYVICEVQRILENNRVLALILIFEGEDILREGVEVLDTKGPVSALKGRTETFEGKGSSKSMYIGEIDPTDFLLRRKKLLMTQNISQKRVEKNVGYVVKMIGPILEIDFPSGKVPRLYDAVVVEGIDNNGLPITVRCQVALFLKNTNRVLAGAPSYGHIRVGMKAIDTETSFHNIEELIEAHNIIEVIHEEMSLSVGRGTPPYFGFYYDTRCKPIISRFQGGVIGCALLLYYAIQFFRRR